MLDGCITPGGPGFEGGGESNKYAGDDIGPDDSGRLNQESKAKPQENSGEVQNEHPIGKIAAALLPDFHHLRNKSEGCAETGQRTENGDPIVLAQCGYLRCSDNILSAGGSMKVAN